MSSLDKLFYWHGIADTYFNYRGECVRVSDDNRLRLLRAMGVNVDSEQAIAEAALELDAAPWRAWLAPFQTCCVTNNHFLINVKPAELEAEFRYGVSLENAEEGGQAISGVLKPSDCEEVGDYTWDGVRYSRRAVPLSQLPLGYHTLSLQRAESGMAQATCEAQLVVVPEQAYNPEWVEAGRRPWGLIVQLYTLRSANNWGIGDFSDLKALIGFAAKYDADMVGLNPLHVLRRPIDDHCSPYSPSDRRFINPLYIDLTRVLEFSDCRPPEEAVLKALRAPNFVDYAAVADLKHRYFLQIFQRFLMREIGHQTERAQAFYDFVEAEGHALEDYCVYCIADELGLDVEPLLQPTEKRAFVEDHAEKLQYHQYLQWLAHLQLAECQAWAEQCGMQIGVMRDLAVGADGGGSEVRTNNGLFCRDAAVGAPPDPLAEKGQNWGLPPMDPAVLRKTGFEHFINLLRKNMENCGALRIDHAMSLLRLWWCPPGKTADFGAYVYYPFQEMLSLLKLESVRHQCLVIGEDMGVVPPELRQALYDSHIFTNKLFYFEKDHDDSFRHPDHYEAKSLAMLTNHDVPTLTSWWAGSDLALRNELDLLEEGVAYDDVCKHRELEKQRLLDWLMALGLIDAEQVSQFMAGSMTPALMAKVLQGASRCASQIFAVQLEDLELMDSPVNVPGTSDQYPNWRRKLAVPIETVFADGAVGSLMSTITQERHDNKPS